MKLQEAKQLIKKTFENPFSRERFTLFVNNLLKDAYEEKPFTQTGAHLPDAFAAYIRKMERIGKYEDADGSIIDILLVELKKERSIEWARATQRNFIRRYLNGSRGGELKDAAIVAFYTEGAEDWRFSLIKMQYSLEKKKDDLTPAKRFSFLVGKNEKSHTAQKQLTGLLTMDTVPTLADIESAFNIETVTREFFEKYKELFLRVNDFFEKQFEKNRDLRKELEAKHIDHISFTKKLLGQIVFLYFLQKKGWLGVAKDGKWGEGDKKFLRSLLDKATEVKQNFYTDYLQYLFYEALAEERRNAADPSYYRLLDCKIPFLNGGLFEADYDWKNIVVKIPNDYFTNENITTEGDTGDGILDVFDRYNFTVKEDEPLEKEVAVDPEMLGKVFENLLEVTDRKSKGAFYTPREIVHYMCQESLINYLDTNLNNNPVSYQKLGTGQTDMFGNKARKGQLPLEVEHGKSIRVERKDIEKFIREGIAAIDNDARVEKAGRETERYSYQLPELIRNHAMDIDKALADIRICDPAIGSGAFPVGIMNEIVKAREILTTYLPANKQKERTAYELKRHCIQECIYGVDIDHSAIDIAKLRLWLSLVVDENDLSKVKPLPNLDYKIVEANSLSGLPDSIVKNDEAEKEMERLKDEYFGETNPVRKKQLRNKINSTVEKFLFTANQFLPYEVDFDFKLFFSEIFHKKNGFDVVIGNPPYGAILDHQQLNTEFTLSKKRLSNSYSYFMEKGLRLLNNRGNITLIVPNTWLSIKSSKELRKAMLVDNTTSHLIFTHQVFESMSNVPPVVDTVIYSCKKEKNSTQEIELYILNQNVTIKDRLKEIESQNWFEKHTTIITEKNDYKVEVNTGFALNLEKMFLLESKDNPNYHVRIGAQEYAKGKGTPPLNGAQIKSRIYHSETKKGKAYLPFVPCGDIQSYSFNWSKTFLKWGDNLHCPREKEIYLNEHLLVSRIYDKKRKKIKVCYVPESSESDFFVNNTDSFNVIATAQNKFYSLKFLLGILNSKLVGYFLTVTNVNLIRTVYPKVNTNDIKEIPIPKNIHISKQTKVLALVDKILDTKKTDPTISTHKWENQIDIIVYHLYELTYEGAKIIDPELSEEEFAKYKT